MYRDGRDENAILPSGEESVGSGFGGAVPGVLGIEAGLGDGIEIVLHLELQVERFH